MLRTHATQINHMLNTQITCSTHIPHEKHHMLNIKTSHAQTNHHAVRTCILSVTQTRTHTHTHTHKVERFCKEAVTQASSLTDKFCKEAVTLASFQHKRRRLTRATKREDSSESEFDSRSVGPSCPAGGKRHGLTVVHRGDNMTIVQKSVARQQLVSNAFPAKLCIRFPENCRTMCSSTSIPCSVRASQGCMSLHLWVKYIDAPGNA